MQTLLQAVIRFYRTHFVIFWCGLFFLFGIVNLIHHELWGDEMTVWLAVRDSDSLAEMLSNKRYDRSPDLWYLVLYPISRFVVSPYAMQFAHLIIATVTVYLVLQFAPFSKLEKILCVFGYFFVYEYAVVNRNYALGVLLIFLFVITYKTRHRYLIRTASILFLLMQTSAYGLIFGISAVFSIAYEYIFQRTLLKFRQSFFQILISLLLVISGVLLSIRATNPPADAPELPLTTGANFTQAAAALSGVWQAFIPIPDLHRQFWSTNLLIPTFKYLPGFLTTTDYWSLVRTYPLEIMSLAVVLIVSIFILIYSLILFSINIRILLLFGLSVVGMLGLSYFKYVGTVRHFGHYFVIWLICLWLLESHIKIRYKPQQIAFKFRKKLLFGIFLIHAFVGFFAVFADWKYPFSAGRDVTDYIKSKHLESDIFVGHGDYPGASVVGYFDQKIMYYPRGDRWGTFIKLDKTRETVSDMEMLERVQDIVGQQKKDVLLILSYPFAGEKYPQYPLVHLKNFPESIVVSEFYRLYLFVYKT